MMKKIMKNARQMRKKRDGWMDENPANEKCKPKKIDLNEKKQWKISSSSSSLTLGYVWRGNKLNNSTLHHSAYLRKNEKGMWGHIILLRPSYFTQREALRRLRRWPWGRRSVHRRWGLWRSRRRWCCGINANRRRPATSEPSRRRPPSRLCSASYWWVNRFWKPPAP